ncbi:MAG: substrate-binding domain-containing protein [Planctomycetota bacterium]
MSSLTGRAATGLAAALRGGILAGELAEGEFLPSVRALSEEHGLAPQTVHRAQKSLAREKLIIAEPRQGYRVLPRRESESAAPIACVVDFAEGDGAWGRTLAAVFEHAAALRGLPLLAVPFHREGPEEIRRQLAAGRARGVLLNTSDPEVLKVVRLSGVPAVMFDSWRPGSGVDSVVQDAFEGAMQAAEHLVGKGHTRVGWLGYETAGGDSQVVERYAGAVGGLAHAGIELASELRVEVPMDNESLARKGALDLLSRSPRPTAVMALWHPVMKGLLAAAAELGLRLGHDLDVVGWSAEEGWADYRSLFGALSPATAITWRVPEMVEVALGRLDERIARPSMLPLQIKIPTRLKSTGSR